MLASSRRSPGSGHGVGVMLVAGLPSLVMRSHFAFSSRSLLRTGWPPHMLVACRSSTYIYLAFPISLNSLDREGARLLSRSGSQITITPDAGPDDSAPGDALELKWEFDEDSQRYYVSFPNDP